MKGWICAVVYTYGDLFINGKAESNIKGKKLSLHYKERKRGATRGILLLDTVGKPKLKVKAEMDGEVGLSGWPPWCQTCGE
jgi:hypothetical protein